MTTTQTFSRDKGHLMSIEAWHIKLFELADVDRDSYVAPSDDELDEMLYGEWLNRDKLEAHSSIR